MREGWEEIPLGDVVSKRSDFTPVVADASYEVVGVQRSGWGLVRREPIRGDAMKFQKLMKLQADNLVFRTITAFEAPSTVVGEEDEGSFVTPQTFPVFTIDSARLLPSYMKLLSTLPSFHEAMSERCTGTVLRRKTLSVSAFQSIPIQLPPLDEQRRIVDLVGAVDDAIEEADDAIWRVRLAHVTTLESLYSEYAGSSSIEEAAEHVIGGSWGEKPGQSEVDVSVIGGTAFANAATSVDRKLGGSRSVKSDALSKRELRTGDIVLEVSGGSEAQPVGRVIRAEEDLPATIPSNFMRLVRINPEVADPSYVYWLMWLRYQQGVTRDFQRNTTGIRNLTVPSYLAAAIDLPAREDQREFAGVADSFEENVREAKACADSLRALRSELLTALLSGTHEIPSAYDEVMAAAA